MTIFIKQKRVTCDPEARRISAGNDIDGNPDMSMIAAFWVLLDFIEKTEFHTIGEYPVKISFFSDEGEYYEIIHVPTGSEILISHALSSKEWEPGKRLVIVDKTSQISGIDIKGTLCFCTVSSEGGVNYYKAT